MKVTYAPDKPQLFWLQEKPEDPQFEPNAGIKMVQVLGSPVYIYDCDTSPSLFHILFLLHTGLT